MPVGHQVHPGVSFTSHVDGGHAVGGTGIDCRRKCAGIAVVRGGELQQWQPRDRGGRRRSSGERGDGGKWTVQAMLLLLGGREMQAGSNPFPSSSIPTKRGDMPHRITSLIRFREKRKERNFEKKIRYTVRKEVASR
ncbi:hypothetical protein ZIOFF_050557 [Zingiber officinale]|uniref:CCT domain-containing protein n=1 Tax=Zingiber officinale TaxID=94328 RepID=A0A8J5KTQ2_ZINOF|nr:hypothetical protein ZIOFF_050557 [Zingiber officinale]